MINRLFIQEKKKKILFIFYLTSIFVVILSRKTIVVIIAFTKMLRPKLLTNENYQQHILLQGCKLSCNKLTIINCGKYK